MSGTAGAYGFRIDGVGEAARLLAVVSSGAPRLAIRQELDDTPSPPPRVDDDAATMALLPDGWLRIDRASGAAEYHVPRLLTMEAVIHPYLAPAAAIASTWQGWDPYHAAGVVVDGGAWAVAGTREVGKSTLVAALASRGFTVMADDLLVIRDRAVLAGPRTIDLRASHAERFGATRALGVTGMRERWRLELEPAPESIPLRGWIYPSWSETIHVSSLPLTERLDRPQTHRAASWRSVRPEHAMWLAGLPGYEFGRPRAWERFDEAVDALIDRLV